MLMTTSPASAAQIAYATDLRDRVRAAGQNDVATEQAIRTIRMAAGDRSLARRLPSWRTALIPARVVREAHDPEGAQAQRDQIAAELHAQRDRVRNTTDEQFAAMTGAEISDFIDNAKAM